MPYVVYLIKTNNKRGKNKNERKINITNYSLLQCS